MLVLFAAVALALYFKYELHKLRQPLVPLQKEKRGASLAVMLLSADGDKFDQNFVRQGEKGGKAASETLHALLREQVGGGEGKETAIILVSNTDKTACLSRSFLRESFLRGFSSSHDASSILSPHQGPGGFAGRTIQLLTMYLPLDSVSHVFVGSLHSPRVIQYFESLSSGLRGKVVLLDFGDLAPRPRALYEVFKSIKIKTSEVEDEMQSVQEVKEEEEEDESLEENSVVEAPKKPFFTYELDFATDTYKNHSAFVGPNALPPPPPGPLTAFTPPKIQFHPAAKPCGSYFLAPGGCRRGSECRFSHDHAVVEPVWDAYYLYVKAQLCPSMRDYGECKWGEDCIMGHRCPYTAVSCPHGLRCYFLRAGLEHSVRP
ncbi:hypothetical protein JCM10213_001186 [Rhodosporidiobolus nylandii]